MDIWIVYKVSVCLILYCIMLRIEVFGICDVMKVGIFIDGVKCFLVCNVGKFFIV